MLRESSELAGMSVDVRGVVDISIGTSVPAGHELVGFADALVSRVGLEKARESLVGSVGPIATARAAGVVANFETMNRILDAGAVQVSEKHRARLGDLGLPLDW